MRPHLERTRPQDRVEFLDAMRAVAMFMVVGQHAIGYSLLDPVTRSKIAPWFQIAVPVFFLVDGFLLLRGYDQKGRFNYQDYIYKSTKRLVIPWALFSILYAFARLAYEYVGDPPERLILNKSLNDLLAAIWVGSPSSQMYFLLSLFFLRTLSFFTIGLGKVSPLMSLYSVVIAGTVWWSSQNTVLLGEHTLKANWAGGQDPLAHAVWGMQFYLAGCAAYRFHSWLSTHAKIVAAVCGSVAIAAPFFAIDFLQQYFYLVGFYALFLAVSSGFSFLSWAGQFTMGIYLTHIPVIMKAISVVGSQVFDPTKVGYYCLVVITVYIVSLLVSIRLLKYPKLRMLLGEKMAMNR